MSRYIDADALTSEQWWVEIQGENIDDIAEQIIKQCKHIVKTAPSIDIVRCKECRRANHELSGIYCGLSDVNMGEDGYCSIGEREGE